MVPRDMCFPTKTSVAIYARGRKTKIASDVCVGEHISAQVTCVPDTFITSDMCEGETYITSDMYLPGRKDKTVTLCIMCIQAIK